MTDNPLRGLEERERLEQGTTTSFDVEHKVVAIGPSGEQFVGWCACSLMVLADSVADAGRELSRHAASKWTSYGVGRSVVMLDAWLADTQQDDARAELRALVVGAIDSADAVTLGDIVDAHHEVG